MQKSLIPNIVVTLILALTGKVIMVNAMNLEEVNTRSTFEIYAAKNTIKFNFTTNYRQLNLDTIQLCDNPFLTAKEIESYDTAHHVITLNVPRDSLTFPVKSVYGQMFVVLVDKKAQYCGFFWKAGSSVPCSWVLILDYNSPLSNLDDKQLQIAFGRPEIENFEGSDPRITSDIIQDLAHSELISYKHDVQVSPYRLYPNPTTKNVFIKGGVGNEKLSIKLYDQQGKILDRIVSNRAFKSIDLTRFSPGIYFVKVNEVKPIKLIKQ